MTGRCDAALDSGDPVDLLVLLLAGRASEVVCAAVLDNVGRHLLPGHTCQRGFDSIVILGADSVDVMGCFEDVVNDRSEEFYLLLRQLTLSFVQHGWELERRLTSRRVQTGFRTRSFFLLVKSLKRPRKVDSASRKLPSALISL